MATHVGAFFELYFQIGKKMKFPVEKIPGDEEKVVLAMATEKGNGYIKLVGREV